MNSVFDIRTFGATGDGTTDVTDRLQDAIDAAESAGGGLVWVPVGSYVISTQLVVDSPNVEVAGASKGGSKIRNLTSGDAAFLVSGDDCAVRNLLVDCEDVGDGGVSVSGARFAQENIRVVNSATAANDRFGGAGKTVSAYKSANETVNNSATLQDDDALTFPVGVNETWAFEIYLIATSASANSDIRVAIAVPAGASRTFSLHPDQAAADLAFETSVVGTTGNISLGLTTNAQGFLIKGVIVNGSTAGSVTLQWAQNGAVAENTTVQSGSYLLAHQLA